MQGAPCNLPNNDDVLHTVAHRLPRAAPRSWVDDVSLRVEGGPRDVLLILPKASALLVQGLRNKGFSISPKSVVFASSPGLAKAVHHKAHHA